MRISTSSYSQSLISRLQTLNASQLKYQEQASTGQKVNKISDDPGVVSQIQQLQSQQREAAALRNNLTTVSSTSEYSLESVDFLREMNQEILDATSTYDPGDTSMLASTIQLLDDLFQQGLSAANSSLNNEYLFAGDYLSTEPFVVTTDTDGTITGVTYEGSTTGTKTVEVGRGIELSPLTNVSDNQNIETYLNTIITLRNALEAGDEDAMSAAINVLEDVDDGFVLAQSDLGSRSQRLEVIEEMEDNLYDTRQDTISKLKDVDLNEVAVKFTQAQTAYEAALQTTSSVLQLSLIDFV